MATPFFTQDSAFTWLESHIQDFFARSEAMKDELIRAGKLKMRAIAENNPDLIAKATQAQAIAQRLLTEQLKWEGRLRDFASYFGLDQRLGAVPIALLAVAIPTALFAYSYMQDANNLSRILDLVESGLVSPTEAGKLKPGTDFFAGLEGALTPLVGLALLGGVAWFAFLRK